MNSKYRIFLNSNFNIVEVISEIIVVLYKITTERLIHVGTCHSLEGSGTPDNREAGPPNR